MNLILHKKVFEHNYDLTFEQVIWHSFELFMGQK